MKTHKYHITIQYDFGSVACVMVIASTVTNLVDKVRLNYKADVLMINSIEDHA